MRIAFFGSDSEMARRALLAITVEHSVVGVFRAVPPYPRRAGHPVRRALGAIARAAGLRRSLQHIAASRGLPLWNTTAGKDPVVARQLPQLRPDLICIATYPWILPPEIYSRPALGAVNLHPSLLPRHRGILPLFWIYFHDDRETGVTLHQVTESADAGAILDQESFPLPRGHSVDRLSLQNAQCGAAVVRRVLGDFEQRMRTAWAQDARSATRAPRVQPGEPMVNFHDWDVERVWHFLAGLWPWFQEPLRDERGQVLPYRGVLGYERRSHQQPVGTASRSRGVVLLYCNDGVVRLAPRRRAWT